MLRVSIPHILAWQCQTHCTTVPQESLQPDSSRIVQPTPATNMMHMHHQPYNLSTWLKAHSIRVPSPDQLCAANWKGSYCQTYCTAPSPETFGRHGVEALMGQRQVGCYWAQPVDGFASPTANQHNSFQQIIQSYNQIIARGPKPNTCLWAWVAPQRRFL